MLWRGMLPFANGMLQRNMLRTDSASDAGPELFGVVHADRVAIQSYDVRD